MKDSTVIKHKDCDMSIRWKLFRGKSSPTPGLFCSCHDVFLDWLPEKVAYELIDVDKIPVEIYVERKRKPKPSLSKENHLKNRQKKKKKVKQAKANYKLKFGTEMPG